MMKTPQQRKFENLVSTIILCEPYITFRSDVLKDFQLASELYYDIFCDKIYDIALIRHHGELAIDERGLAYSDKEPKSDTHIYFQILTKEDLLTNGDDIIIYIDIALAHLEEELAKIKATFK